MMRALVSGQEIADVLYRKVTDGLFSDHDQVTLDKWVAHSTYNKMLLKDILSDKKLQLQIKNVNANDHSQFWNTVLSYRTGLHSGMNRHGNLWQRLARSVRGIFIFRQHNRE